MTEIARRTPMQEVCDTIASPAFRERVKQGAEGQGVSVDRFVRVTLTALQTNPELITADRQSLYMQIIRSAQDGLMPDGREAALVIRKVRGKPVAVYMPMILGLRKKAAEHGFSLSAYVVYQADVFRYSLGLDPHIIHEPPPLGDERGDPIGAYAVATGPNGEKYLEVMNRAEIEQVRAVSTAATSEYGPWVNWWGEQARKTVARRLFKTLPLGGMSERTASVVDAIDSEYEFGGEAMSLEEANLVAQLDAPPSADDAAPDDALVAEEDIPWDGEPQMTFAEQAEAAQRKRAARGAE